MATKGLVKFRKDKCKGCELCITVCPKKIIASETSVNAMGYHPVGQAEPDKCVGCANCAIMCPDGVISVYKTSQEGQS